MPEARKTGSDASRVAVYVHVPFCRRRCPFCGSYGVGGGAERADDFLRAVRLEWQRVLEEDGWRERATEIASIYIGGGTPSLLGGARLRMLLESLREGLPWSAACEVSVQLNPEDVSADLARELLRGGFSRVSLGVQSFDDDALKAIGRQHTAADARAAITALQDAGCENLNLDLMFGLPGQSLAAWGESLASAIAFEPQHLGIHPLTRAESTALDRLLTATYSETPLSEETLHPYQRAQTLLADAGYALYEVANASRPGLTCRHLLQVWSRGPLLGLGPAAHSLSGSRRWRTVCDLDTYLRSLLAQEQRPPRDGLRLGAADQAREEIYLGLRQARGFFWSRLASFLAGDAIERMRRKARFLAAQGYLRIDAESACLQPQAYYVADSVALELIAALAGGPA